MGKNISDKKERESEENMKSASKNDTIENIKTEDESPCSGVVSTNTGMIVSSFCISHYKNTRALFARLSASCRSM